MIKNFEKAGHPSQLFGVEEMRLVGGKGDGMRLLQLRSGMGLMATVAPDRCLDIYRLEYKGMNLGFFSPAGYVAPQYYDKDEFLRNFTAGFFTTCGTKNAGSPCDDNGEECVTHGRISNTPCEQLSYSADYTSDHPLIKVSGNMNQGVLFNEKYQLHREITMENNSVTVSDTLTNLAGETQPVMQLYHMNMGYPLLDEGVKIILPTKKVTPRDARAAEGTDEWNVYPAPETGFAEQCYYHDLASKNGKSFYAVYNPERKTGVKVTFSSDTLDHFTQWKMPGVRDYVLGMEPANCHVEGRAKMRADGKLKFLKPFESVTFTLKIDILDGDADACECEKLANELINGK